MLIINYHYKIQTSDKELANWLIIWILSSAELYCNCCTVTVYICF